MLENSKELLNSINNIKNQMLDTKSKMDNSKKLSIVCFIGAGIFFIVFIILISLFFTISSSSKLFLIFSIVTLVIAFIFLQIAIVTLLVVRYLYKEKLNTLLKASELIKKEINK